MKKEQKEIVTKEGTMQDAYSKAIRRLVNFAETQENPSTFLRIVLAVLRGPDQSDLTIKRSDLKSKYTAPLRLYLLGKKAYLEGNYGPRLEEVSAKFVEPKGPDHFSIHIRQAQGVIRESGLKSHDASFRFRWIGERCDP